MEDEATQAATQPIMDGRRVGRNNSGLNSKDLADVMVILTASSRAAFQVVEEMTKSRPEHVLYSSEYGSFENQFVDVEEQETILIEKPNMSLNSNPVGTSLALRFSSLLKTPSLGFVFGRNEFICDIVMGHDKGKRTSNQHFRIYFNHDLVVMLEDMSTNGTVVDDVVLKGRDKHLHKQRMLNTGSVVRVQTSNDADFVEFIARIPSRVDHLDEFRKNVREFMTRCATTDDDYKALERLGNNLLGNSRVGWDGSPNYNIVGKAGQGAFATVYQVATKLEGKIYAAKEISKREFVAGGMRKKLENELNIMSSLQHEHIVQYVENVRTTDHIYIIMEYVRHGDVGTLFRERGSLSEDTLKILARQMLLALIYLHDQNITHRDIKPDNILIAQMSPTLIFKLADFGLSKNMLATFMTTFCGTLLYCAPEVFPENNKHKHGVKRGREQALRQDFYDHKVDIYSLGAVLWHVLAGAPPVAGNSGDRGQAMYPEIMASTLDRSVLRRKNTSEPCIDLLCAMLEKQAVHRPTARQCLMHDWLNDGTVVPKANTLESIAEEDLSHEAGEQFSQLSLREIPQEIDETGFDVLDDEEFERLIDVRQSKRARVDPFFPRYQIRDHEHNSSAEPSFQSHHDLPSHVVEESFQALPVVTGRQRLFGEIGQSALQASGVLNEHANEALSQVVPTNGIVPDSVLPSNVLALNQSGAPQRRSAGSPGQQGLQFGGSFTSPSLCGAEYLVGEMNMQSPQSPASNPPTPSEPVTPRTPDILQHNSLESDPTPKAKPALNRQISLPKTPSLFYDPRDPNTHNPEYASRVSGHDFISGSGAATTDEAPIADKSQESGFTQDARSGSAIQSSTVPAASAMPPRLDIKPPPRRLGKLIATPDSFEPQLVLPIDKNRTSWGRIKENDLVYEHRSDTRIPKTAFTIFWHSSDQENIDQLSQEGKDWTSLKNMQVGIVTGATSGIQINGTHLRKTDADGNAFYGWLHTGDIVEVYHQNGGPECLKFKCEFYFGTGKEPRPVGKAFTVRSHSKVDSA